MALRLASTTGGGGGAGGNDALEEARRKLAQAERMFAASGDYETQAREARANFLRPEVQDRRLYSMLGVDAPPEVAGYQGDNPLVSGRPLTTIEQLERTQQREDLDAASRRLSSGGGRGYAIGGGGSGGGGGGGIPASRAGYTTNKAPVQGQPIVGNPIQAGFYGDTRRLGPGGQPAQRGGSATGDPHEEIMKAVGLVPTNYTADGRSNPITEYVRPEEAAIRKKRYDAMVSEEYDRRFGLPESQRSRYAGLSEDTLIRYAIDEVITDEELLHEFRTRRDKSGTLAFTDAEVDVILRAVRKQRADRDKKDDPLGMKLRNETAQKLYGKTYYDEALTDAQRKRITTIINGGSDPGEEATQPRRFGSFNEFIRAAAEAANR